MWTCLRRAAVIALATALVACGAADVDAPAPPSRVDCPTVDTYLDPLYALVDAGELDALASAVRDRLPDDARRDLVASLLRLARSFEPGTFSALGDLFGAEEGPAEGEAGLQATLGELLAWIEGGGPGSPYRGVFGAARRALNSCEGPPILAVARDALGDDALLRAVVELLGGDLLADALASVRAEGAEGREAFRLLVRNLMVSAIGPSFDVETVTALLDLLADTSTPPWSDLKDGVARLLAPGPSLDAVQGFLACLLDVDPDVTVAPLVYDAVTAEGLSLSSLIDAAPEDGPVIAPALGSLLRQVLDFLVADAEARRSLVAVLTELMRDAVWPAVLRDLSTMLSAEVLGDVVELLAVLARGGCER